MAKVFIGLPIFNFQDTKVKRNQDNILLNSKHEIVYGEIIGASVEHARQMLINQFLKTDCDYFLNLDADIVFLNNLDVIDELIKCDKDIVGGLYFYKKPPCLPVYRPLDLQEIYEKEGKFPLDYKFNISNDLFEVNWLGNGLKLVKRNVIETIKNKISVPNLPMIYKNEYISEDWAFDQRSRESGFTVWINPKIKLGHLGSYTYKESDFMEYQNGIN